MFLSLDLQPSSGVQLPLTPVSYAEVVKFLMRNLISDYFRCAHCEVTFRLCFAVLLETRKFKRIFNTTLGNLTYVK